MRFTFKKNERLKRKIFIDKLFQKGSAVKSFPLRIIYLPFDYESFSNDLYLPKTTQIAISVPKKRFKNATDRNLIKRRIRESYRINKHILNKPFAIAFVYMSNEKLTYQQIEKAMIKGFEKLDEIQ